MSRRVGASPAPDPTRWSVESDEAIEQVASAGQAVRLQKSRLRLDSRLAVVRKRLPCVTGPAVVLVHGFAQNRYTWHSTGRSMSAWLAGKGFDVYVLELRGHGNSRASGSPETGSPDSFADYVVDAEALASALPGPAFWIGHSLGGAVAYALATRAPVRGVVGLGAVYRFGQTNRVIGWLARASHFIAANRGFGVNPRGALGALSVKTRFAGQVVGRLFSFIDAAGYALPVSGWAPGSIEPELLAERLERGFDWTSLHVWLDMSCWAAGDELDYEAAWRATDVPLLVITGDLDHFMPPADARAAFDESGSSDRELLNLEPWNTGSHWGHLDLVSGTAAPEQVWQPILAWLGER